MMSRPGWRLSVLCAGLVLLQGCATMSAGPQTEGAGAGSAGGWPERVGSAGAGEWIELPVSNELGVEAVRVGAPYTAASGRQCRRMTGADERTLPRLVCADEQRGWYLTRSLSVLLHSPGPAMAAALPAGGAVNTGSAQSATAMTAADSQSVTTFELGSGETLWSFAQRTTGDPLNWEAIASHNGIESSVTVPAGARLAVPSALIDANE